jgi:hypothetical protein
MLGMGAPALMSVLLSDIAVAHESQNATPPAARAKTVHFGAVLVINPSSRTL